jgi:hypothetical protein
MILPLKLRGINAQQAELFHSTTIPRHEILHCGFRNEGNKRLGPAEKQLAVEPV